MPKTEIDQKVTDFLRYLKTNGNMEKLGTNSDNRTEPVHRWFSFLPGFSHVFVKTTLEYFYPKENGAKDFTLHDPFMGSATTAAAGKSFGINVVGNESNLFLYKIGKAKIHVVKDSEALTKVKQDVLAKARNNWKKQDVSGEHKLLRKCYINPYLKKLIALRNIYNSSLISDEFKPYLFLVISALLPRCSSYGISIPYVSWSHERIPEEPFELFAKIFDHIKDDLSAIDTQGDTETKIYLHDSRIKNERIKKDSIDLVFTSPPYLNNFDYGEALKVYSYFWGLTDNWNEITKKIREKSITSATTHYKDREYREKSAKEILGEDFCLNAPKVANTISDKIALIVKAKAKKETREKSFDVLVGLYFKDMYTVLKELKRVMKKNSLCFVTIGDSAPYGIYIPTDEILGKLAIEAGFSKYSIEPLRMRGRKWLNLTHRHKVTLRESLLVLRK
jgi:DNA modification methylase